MGTRLSKTERDNILAFLQMSSSGLFFLQNIMIRFHAEVISFGNAVFEKLRRNSVLFAEFRGKILRGRIIQHLRNLFDRILVIYQQGFRTFQLLRQEIIDRRRLQILPELTVQCGGTDPGMPLLRI